MFWNDLYDCEDPLLKSTVCHRNRPIVALDLELGLGVKGLKVYASLSSSCKAHEVCME